MPAETSDTAARPRLYLIDGYSNIFRAFYAIRNLSNSRGEPTNAVYGFIQMLRKLLREDNPELVWNLSWRSILSARSILNVSWAGFSGRQDFNPASGFSIPGRVDAQTGFASDNAALFHKFDRTRNQVNASFTHSTDDHELKFGTEIERSLLHDTAGFPGGAFFSDNNGPQVDPSTGNHNTLVEHCVNGTWTIVPEP